MREQRFNEVLVDSILVPSNVRSKLDESVIAAIVATADRHGIAAIDVYLEEGQPVLLSGEHRLEAAKRQGLRTIWARVGPPAVDQADRIEAQLTENLVRSDLNPVDKAMGLARLKTLRGWTLEELARRFAISTSMAAKLLCLPQMPPETQQQIRSGQISVSAAYELWKIKDGAIRDQLAQQVANGELSRDGLVEAAKRIKRRPKTAAMRRTKLSPARSRPPWGPGPLRDLDELIAWLKAVLTQAKMARVESNDLDEFFARQATGPRQEAAR